MTADRQITLTRLLMAPLPKVWRCWTDPALLPRWFGPEGHSCHTKEIDLREGGLWRFDMIGPDGTVWPSRHRYTQMTPQSRIAFLMDGDSDAGAPPMEVLVTLTPEGAGTRIIQTITFPTPEGRATALGFGADRLGQTTLAKLDAAASSL